MKKERKKSEPNKIDFIIAPLNNIVFSAEIPRRASSPYIDALIGLQKQPQATVKCRDSSGARNGFKNASARLGLKLLYAIQGDELLVRLAGVKIAEPKLDAVAPGDKLSATSVRVLILEQLIAGPMSSNDLIQAVRAIRSSIAPQQVYAACSELRAAKKIEQIHVHGENKNRLVETVESARA